ncbi:MAG: DNA ligase D [Actinomycetota bacterium]|nr:DNA ligase D [Actinomycetota bacterium]
MEDTKTPEPDRLAEYHAKRNPEATPEPFGGTSGGSTLQFVIQKHAATRLHYDLRLEQDGVLLSWAVPAGISLDPSVKRFAAHTEDRSLDYSNFEGVIPSDQYGGGPMIVWDRGSVSFIEDIAHGMKHGKLLFDLHGYKIRGRFTLVKTTKGRKDWLLIKKPDEWSSTEDVPFDETSVLSGRTVEEVATGQSGADRAAALMDLWDVPEATRKTADAKPMLAEVADAPFSKKGWLFEIKYDGYRMLAHKSEDLVLLRYRSGIDATDTFPEIAAAVASLPCSSLILDGEVVILGEDGKPSFSALQKRGKLTNRFDVRSAATSVPATMFTFDLLSLQGRDLRSLPLVKRKEALASLTPSVGPIRFADHVLERGIEMFDSASAMGLEGIMAKRSDSRYLEGRSDAWLKMKVEHTHTFAVIGFTRPEGTRTGFGSLHLAALRNGGLSYAGRVGTGFTAAQIARTHKELVDAKTLSTHVEDLPTDVGSTWTEPQIFVDVRYKEITNSGALRQPTFISQRVGGTLSDLADLGQAHFDPSEPAPVGRLATSAGHQGVRTSNLDKVFWPAEGYTKRDLISYYAAASEALLPYLCDRPLVTVRYPDGIDGKSFYQKNAPDFVPVNVRTEWIVSSDDERGNNLFVCDNAESLTYIVNLGAIPLHIWSARVATIDTPDWCILDLDPKSAPFSSVIAVAKRIKTLCDDMGLPSFPKTSGQSGLHVLIPMGDGHTFTQQKLLGELLARVVESDLPDIATTVRSPGARGDRVYIDFLQNGKGKLIAAPYAARPVPGATVSTPIRWSEVTSKLDPSKFTIATVPRRIARMKDDPLAGVLVEIPDIDAGLRSLASSLR